MVSLWGCWWRLGSGVDVSVGVGVNVLVAVGEGVMVGVDDGVGVLLGVGVAVSVTTGRMSMAMFLSSTSRRIHFALKLLHDAGLTRRDQKPEKSSLSLNIRAENEGQIVNLLPESSRRSRISAAYDWPGPGAYVDVRDSVVMQIPRSPAIRN